MLVAVKVCDATMLNIYSFAGPKKIISAYFQKASPFRVLI